MLLRGSRLEWCAAAACAGLLALVYAGLPAAAVWKEREADRRWRALLYAPDEVPVRRPARASNACARGLLTLALPRPPLVQLMVYADEQSQRPEERVAAPEGLVAEYLAQNEAALARLAASIRAAPPEWGYDDGGYRFDDQRQKPYWLVDVLDARALAQLAGSQVAAAAETLEARWLLSRDDWDAWGRSSRLMDLVRRLDPPFPAWALGVAARDERRLAAERLVGVSWLRRARTAAGRRERRIKLGLFRFTLFELPPASYARWDTAQAALRDQDAAARVLRGGDLCASPVLPVRRTLLSQELTALVLGAKKRAAESGGGTWPETLEGLESKVCPSGRWDYVRAADGSASVRLTGAAADLRAVLAYEMSPLGGRR
jgi:hypothetical protein